MALDAETPPSRRRIVLSLAGTQQMAVDAEVPKGTTGIDSNLVTRLQYTDSRAIGLNLNFSKSIKLGKAAALIEAQRSVR
jgi:hypothetical protein